MNYESLYKSKAAEYDELLQDYTEFKDLAKMIETELEEQCTAWRTRCEAAEEEIISKVADLGKRLETERAEGERLVKEIEVLKQQIADQDQRSLKDKKKRVELENVAEAALDEIRFKDAMIEDLNTQLNDALERMTVIEMDAQETKEFGESQRRELLEKLHQLQDEMDAKKRRSLIQFEE